jgi:DNA-directed RNA polymerase alpha subunit
LNRFDRGDPEADAAASPPACRFGVEGEGEMSEQHILDPTPELPDDTPIENVQLPTRIRNVLAAAGLKTVGEVRETADETLLSFQDFGPGSITHLRETLGLPSRELRR